MIFISKGSLLIEQYTILITLLFHRYHTYTHIYAHTLKNTQTYTQILLPHTHTHKHLHKHTPTNILTHTNTHTTSQPRLIDCLIIHTGGGGGDKGPVDTCLSPYRSGTQRTDVLPPKHVVLCYELYGLNKYALLL